MVALRNVKNVWDVMLCRPVCSSRHLKGHEPERKDTVIVETSGTSYPLTQGSIPEDRNISLH
jgi:hypothetical protein